MGCMLQTDSLTVTITRTGAHRFEWSVLPQLAGAPPNPSRFGDPACGPPHARTALRAERRARRYVERYQRDFARPLPVSVVREDHTGFGYAA